MLSRTATSDGDIRGWWLASGDNSRKNNTNPHKLNFNFVHVVIVLCWCLPEEAQRPKCYDQFYGEKRTAQGYHDIEISIAGWSKLEKKGRA